MTDELDPAEPIVGFNRHPAAIGGKALLRPAYPAPNGPYEPGRDIWGEAASGAAIRDAADQAAADRGLVTWDPTARFAPPGPATLQQPMLDVVVSLALPHGLPASSQVTRSQVRLMPVLGDPEPQQPIELPPPAPEPPVPETAVPEPPAPELPVPELPVPELPVPETAASEPAVPKPAVPELSAAPPAPPLPEYDPAPMEAAEEPETVLLPEPYPATELADPQPPLLAPADDEQPVLPPDAPDLVQAPEPQPSPEFVATESLLPLSPRDARGFWRDRIRRRRDTPTTSDAEPGPLSGFDPQLAFETSEAPGQRPSAEQQPTAGEQLWPEPISVYADVQAEDDGRWEAEPDVIPTRRQSVRPMLLRRGLAALAALGVLIGVVVLVVRIGALLLNEGSVTAVFNAPMMVVRAAVTGRVMVISANAGEIVDPRSPLFTIHTTDAISPDRSVLADVHGVVRSVETVPGQDLTAGTPLVRIQDCDKAFLTIPATAKLSAGERVRVKLPNYPAVTGTMRASAGVMEPPDSLVVGLVPNAIPGACPVGARAEVTPIAKGT